MPNSSRLNWPYPAENQDPWFDAFEDLITAQDATGYAHREDRNLIMGKGGTVSFSSGTGVLSWSEDFEIYSTTAGFRFTIAAGSVTLEDGELFYVDLTRAPTTNLTVTPVVASQVPTSDNSYAIAIRRGDDVFFRFGRKISDGESFNVFEGGGGSGSIVSRQILRTISQPADGSSFSVTISPAMPDTDYVVIGQLATVGSHITMNVPTSGRTTTSFDVVTSSALADGETIYFMVAAI